MTSIYDLNGCKTNDRNGKYGGAAGSKEGITWNGANWIIKYPQSTRGMKGALSSYTTSPLSEYIGSHIYAILGYDVHETELGIRNGKLVVACRDFCDTAGDLMEIRTLKNTYNPMLAEKLDESFSSTSSDHLVDLNELMIHLKYNPILSNVPGITERFWDCAVIDILINNNDRNNGNWGLLRTKKGDFPAPIFDNGGSFYNKATEERISNYLCDDEKMLSSATNTRTVYGLEDKILQTKDLLKLNNPDLHNAIKRTVPLICKKMPEIESFLEGIPDSCHGISVCSVNRKMFYIKGMKLRIEKLLEPALAAVLAATPS